MRRFSEPEIVKNFKYSKFPELKPLTVLLYSFATVNAFYQSNHSLNETLSHWLLYGYIATTTLVVILITLQRYLKKRYGNKIPVHLIYLSGLTLGVIKGVGTYTLVNHFVVKDAFPWDELFLEGYSKGFMGLGLAFLFSLRASYVSEITHVRRYNRLNNERLVDDISYLKDEISSLKLETRQQVISRIVRNREFWRKIDLYSSNPEENSKKISEVLRGDVTEHFRSQSHSLAQLDNSSKDEKKRIKASLQLKVLNIHPRVFALIQFSIGASVSYQDWTPRDTYWNLIVNTVIVLLVAKGFKEMLEKEEHRSTASNWSAVILMMITILTLFTLAQYAIRGEMWAENPLLFMVPVFFWELFLLLTISTVSELIDYHDSISKLEAEVGLDLEDKRRILTENYELVRHDLAKHIHGFLINKIQTTSWELDRLAQDEKYDEYQHTLKELFNEFSLESIEAKLNSQELNSDFIESLEQSWEGLISVVVKLDDQVYECLQKAQALEVGRVLEEMVGNSFRHGNASKIDISIICLGNRQLEITARDNGQGVRNERKPGLGSYLFETASDGNWSLGNHEYGGAQVLLNVVLYEPESELV
jgi:signal transduction histidine kinase